MSLYIPRSKSYDKNFYFEFSLCEYDGIPIVFVATDDDRSLYLCECTDMRFGEQNWTIAATTGKTIRELIDQQITLYEGLKRNASVILVKCDLSTRVFTHQITPFAQLTSEDIPEENSFVWITNEQIESDLRNLLLKLCHTSTQTASILRRDTQVYTGTHMGNTSTCIMDDLTLSRQSIITTTDSVNSAYIGIITRDSNGAEAA